MSHESIVYTMPARVPGPGRNNPWQVRERDREETEELLALTDLIQNKLSTAEALAWVLNGSEHHPTGAEKVTAGVIAELIHEAAEAHDRQWEIIRKYRKLEE